MYEIVVSYATKISILDRMLCNAYVSIFMVFNNYVHKVMVSYIYVDAELIL